MIDFIQQGFSLDEHTRYVKVERYKEDTTQAIASSVRNMLAAVDDDPDREGLKDTPMRVAKAMQFCTQGYQTDPEKISRRCNF